jgi:cytochrome P450
MDVHQAMMDLTMEIVALALFNTDVTGEADVVQSSMDVLLKVFSDRNRQFLLPEWLPTPSRRRFHQSTEQLDLVVFGIIQERRSTPPDSHPQDLLEMLLNARDENGEQMTDRQLRDEVMTLFLAGHETTANALSWTWMLLSQNPQVETCLQEELEEVLKGRVPTIVDLPSLPYTAKVVKESMRLYPPAWVIGRQAIEDVEIGGHAVEKDAGVLMSQWVMHHNPRFYPDANAFRPERWDEAFTRQLPEFAYFPFGGGPRLCIGKPFALQEAALVLAMVAQRFKLELLPGKRIVPRPSITLRPFGGVWVKVIRR